MGSQTLIWGDMGTCTFLIVEKVRSSLELLSARFVRSAVRAWPRVAHCMRVEPCTGQYRSEATPPLSVFDVVQAPRAIQPLGGSYLVCVVAESVHALRVVIDSSSNHPPTVLASRSQGFYMGVIVLFLFYSRRGDSPRVER